MILFQYVTKKIVIFLNRETFEIRKFFSINREIKFRENLFP